MNMTSGLRHDELFTLVWLAIYLAECEVSQLSGSFQGPQSLRLDWVSSLHRLLVIVNLHVTL